MNGMGSLPHEAKRADATKVFRADDRTFSAGIQDLDYFVSFHGDLLFLLDIC
jgi:hypothetical protein